MMSVSGESVEGFSAVGKLRVSSTFAFVAQYCMFLNAATFILAAVFFLRERGKVESVLLSPWVLVVMLIIGTYITGSRGAVIGNGFILGCAGVLLVLRGNWSMGTRFLVTLVITWGLLVG